MNSLPVRDLTIGIVGSGGDGVIAIGELIVQAAAREGLHALLLKAFGPEIRGGEALSRVRISTAPIFSQGDALDVLAVFSWDDYYRFESELALNSRVIILHDEKAEGVPARLIQETGKALSILSIPFTELAMQSAGQAIAKNMVMLGVLSELFNLPFEGLLDALESKFRKKGEALIEKNQAALQCGREHIRTQDLFFQAPKLKYSASQPRMVMTGNDALACGALSAGCRFYAGYPITPSSEIMEWLAKELPRMDGVMIQTEDEISAINMIIGASHAGAKALTATSGPGLSLMQEAIGLAAISETPCVIMNVQRVGPSTGIPTKSEQSDLLASIFGSHGDAPKVVLAATDVRHSFFVARKAFAISERYQIPVIVLSDQFIGHRFETIEPIPENLSPVDDRLHPQPGELDDYKRFQKSSTGVSPVAPLGLMGGEYLASGIEHDELGRPASSFTVHQEMNEKRYKKLALIEAEYGEVNRFGAEKAEIGLIGWGSSQGVMLEAIEQLANEGIQASALVPEMIYPLPLQLIDEYLDTVQQALVIELSYSAQFYRLLRAHTAHPERLVSLARSGAKTLTVNEIIQHVAKAQDVLQLAQ